MSGLDTINAFNASGAVTDVAANTVALGTDTTGNYVADVDAGNAITVSGTAGEGTTFTVNHSDTSSQTSVNNSGSTFIQDVTLDTYGHVTGLTSATVSSGAPSGNAVGTVLTMVGYNPGNVSLGAANPSVAGTSNSFSSSSPVSARSPSSTGANWITSNSAHSALAGTWRPTNASARYGGNTFTYDTWIRVS